MNDPQSTDYLEDTVGKLLLTYQNVPYESLSNRTIAEFFSVVVSFRSGGSYSGRGTSFTRSLHSVNRLIKVEWKGGSRIESFLKSLGSVLYIKQTNQKEDKKCKRINRSIYVINGEMGLFPCPSLL